LFKISNNSNTISNKSFESINPIQRELGELLLEFLQINLFYTEKQNKNEFWQQLRKNCDTVVIEHSFFKGHNQITQYFDLLSPKEIEETFSFTIQRFSNSKLIDRHFIFLSAKEISSK
jgi:hypothetical protein